MGLDRDAAARLPWSFVLALLALGAVLFATVIPGVFSIDEDNYLVNVIAVRQGHVTVANTAGLSPSRELVFFDPEPRSRVVSSTPVASTAPPLYGPLAVPFSWFGWRGLVAINLLAYLGTTILVFVYAGRYATSESTPWLAAGAFALGGFAIEYAQGLWPHALSIALCTGGILAAGRVLEWGSLSMAATAGFLLALAAGVRYQNAVILVAAGAGIALWSVRRWRNSLGFAVAAAVPLAASAAINYARLDSWNPISKGPMYLRVPLLDGAADTVLSPLFMFWARIVDFSVRPPLVGPSFSWMQYEPETGAHLMMGDVIQKSVLQSAPWAVLGFLVFVAAWLPGLTLPDARRRQLRLLSLITAAVVVTFAFSGVLRHEGLSFNQRYHLELLPLLAVGFAWSIDRFGSLERPFWGGVLGGMVMALVLLFGLSPGTSRTLLLLKVPVIMAAAMAGLWFLAWRGRTGPLLTGVAGLCLGWGLALHLGDDLPASRMLRAWKYQMAEQLRAVVPDHSALIAYGGSRDAAGPLLFDRDVVIIDAHADDGEAAPTLVRELLARGRRVFVLRRHFHGRVLERVLADWAVVRLPGTDLLELRAGPVRASYR
jgi:hypothetical protein